jgi:hypothetical protein
LLAVALFTICGAGKMGDLRAQKVSARGQQRPPGRMSHNTCPARLPGSAVVDPEDLRSVDGQLTVDLTLHNYKEADGSTRYCYMTPERKRVAQSAAESGRSSDSQSEERP